MALNVNIKIARENKKLTQLELGNLVGVSNTVISNWEKGLNKPDADMLCKLCYALDVDANFLLDYQEQNNTTNPSIDLTPQQLEFLNKFIEALKEN